MKHKQNKIVYLVTSIGNLDETVDFEDEVPKTFDTENEALEEAKQEAEEYGLRNYVYKCIPILRVDRGALRISKVVAKD